MLVVNTSMTEEVMVLVSEYVEELFYWREICYCLELLGH